MQEYWLYFFIITPSAWLICDKQARRLGISRAHIFSSRLILISLGCKNVLLIFCNPYVSIVLKVWAKYDSSAVFPCLAVWFITLLPSYTSKTMQVNHNFLHDKWNKYLIINVLSLWHFCSQVTIITIYSFTRHIASF